MFITKKAYYEAIAKEVKIATENYDRKMYERDKEYWESRKYDEYNKQLDELRKRIYELEKATGLVKDTPCCPMNLKAGY